MSRIAPGKNTKSGIAPGKKPVTFGFASARKRRVSNSSLNCVEAVPPLTSAEDWPSLGPVRSAEPTVAPVVKESGSKVFADLFKTETLPAAESQKKGVEKTSIPSRKKKNSGQEPSVVERKQKKIDAQKEKQHLKEGGRLQRHVEPDGSQGRVYFSRLPRRFVDRKTTSGPEIEWCEPCLHQTMRAGAVSVIACAIERLRIPNPPVKQLLDLAGQPAHAYARVLAKCREFSRSEKGRIFDIVNGALLSRFERRAAKEHLVKLSLHREQQWNALPLHTQQVKDYVRGIRVANLRGEATRVALYFIALRPSDQAEAYQFLLKTRSLGRMLRLEKALSDYEHVTSVRRLLMQLRARIRWFQMRQQRDQRHETNRTDHQHVVEEQGFTDFVTKTAVKIGESVDWAIDRATDLIVSMMEMKRGSPCSEFRPRVVKIVRFIFLIVAPTVTVTSGAYLLLRSWFKKQPGEGMPVEFHGPSEVEEGHAGKLCELLNNVFNTKAFHSAGSLARSFTNIISAAKSAREIFHDFMEWVCRTVFRVTYLGDDNADDFIINSTFSLRQVIDYVEPLFEIVDGEPLYKKLVAQRDLFRVLNAQVLVSRARAYISTCDSREFHYAYTSRALERFAKEIDASLVGISKGTSLRTKPVVLYLVGEPGSGKSSCRDPLLQAAYAILARKTGEHEFTPSFDVYAKDKKSEFWSGYNNQRCLYIDDFLQVKDANLRVGEFQTLFDVYNSDNCALNMAELHEKGNHYFTSELIYMTSNVRKETFSTYVESQAFLRRLHVYAEVERGNRGQDAHDPRAVTYKCTIRRGDNVQERTLSFDAFATLIAHMIAYERKERDNRARSCHRVQEIAREDAAFIEDMFGAMPVPPTVELGPELTAFYHVQEGQLFNKMREQIARKIAPPRAAVRADMEMETIPRAADLVVRPSTTQVSATRTWIAKRCIDAEVATRAAITSLPLMHYNTIMHYLIRSGLLILLTIVKRAKSVALRPFSTARRTLMYGASSAHMFTHVFESTRAKIALLGAAGLGATAIFVGLFYGIVRGVVQLVASVVAMVVGVMEGAAPEVEHPVVREINQNIGVSPPTNPARVEQSRSVEKVQSQPQSGQMAVQKRVVRNHGKPQDVESVPQSGVMATQRKAVKNHGGPENLEKVSDMYVTGELPGCKMSCPDCGVKVSCNVKKCDGVHAALPCNSCVRWREASGLNNAGTLTVLGTRYVAVSVVGHNQRIFTSQYGLDIGQRRILCTRHFIECFQKEYSFDSNVYIRVEDSSHNVYVADTRVINSQDSDLGILQAIGGTTRKSLLSRFVTSRSMPKDNSDLFRCGPLDGGTCHRAAYTDARTVDAYNRRLRCGLVRMHGKVGMCGTAYVTLDNAAGAGRIVGIHFGGVDGSTKSVFSYTTQEGVKAMSDALTNILTPPVEPAALADEYVPNARDIEEVPCAYVNQSLCVGGSASSNIEVATHRFEKGDLPIEPVTAPANLSMTAMKLGIASYGSTSVFRVPPDVHYTVINEIVEYWNKLARRCPTGIERKVYTFEQGVNGVVVGEARRKFADRLNPHTSAGFLFRDAVKGKNAYIEFDGLTATWSPQLQELVERRISAAAEGRALPHCVIATLKDERRPIEKVVAMKTRVFALCQLDVNIALRMYFGAFFEETSAHHTYGEVSVGINMEDPVAVGGWYNLLKGSGDHWIAGDYSGWDKNISSALGDAFIEIVNRWYNDCEENQVIRRVLGRAIFEADHLFKKQIFNRHKTMPSGIPGTAIANSVINSYIMRVCFKRHVRGSYDHNVQARFYGDDHVLRISDDVRLFFNQRTIAQDVKELFGIGYTSVDKKEVVEEITSDDDLTYLKRSFHSEGELVYARLPLTVIDEIMLWSDNGEDHDANQSCVNSAFCFYQQYGREFYESQKKRWRDFGLKSIYRIPDFAGFENLPGAAA